MVGSNRQSVSATTKLHAAYLHARQPADARIALWSDDGVEPTRAMLPAELAAVATPINAQLLLPTEETELTPISDLVPSDSDEDRDRCASHQRSGRSQR